MVRNPAVQVHRPAERSFRDQADVRPLELPGAEVDFPRPPGTSVHVAGADIVLYPAKLPNCGSNMYPILRSRSLRSNFMGIAGCDPGIRFRIAYRLQVRCLEEAVAELKVQGRADHG